MPTKKTTHTETYRLKGQQLVHTVKQLIQEGNIRKITITDKNEKTLAVFPLTAGVVGIFIAPMLAAVTAIAALVTECTITVEKTSKRK